ncbi:MAG: class I SAM-dependent methyltransferase [Caldilineaceae bacterium]|nr:class I SAM-dependent methyltransferase [Caldilineaceae bacterium]
MSTATPHIRLELDEETRDYHCVLRAAIMRLVHECQLNSGKRRLSILDVGCGRGELLTDLVAMGHNVHGVDFDEQCLVLSSQFAPVTKGSIYELDQLFSEKPFDLVIASHVIEHLESPVRGVEQMKRVSRSFILIAVPNLAEARNLKLLRKEPGYVNRGHYAGWDPAHLNTFLHYACDIKVEKWEADRVYIPRPLRRLLGAVGMIENVQDKWLPKLIPLQSHSLIVLGSI